MARSGAGDEHSMVRRVLSARPCEVAVLPTHTLGDGGRPRDAKELRDVPLWVDRLIVKVAHGLREDRREHGEALGAPLAHPRHNNVRLEHRPNTRQAGRFEPSTNLRR